MSKVAIVGVEGSGKTVLMASLSECFGKISESEPYLMPENQSAYTFMQQVPHRLRVDRAWPGATGIDALRTMRWTLRSGQTVLNTIEMLDYPGELYRLAFGERSAEELAAHRAELDEFLEHLTDADTLIVLFNLADVENQGANARNAETVWITRGIFDYAKTLPNLKRQHLVFTQADRYAAALKEAGGADGLFAQKLPMLKLLHPDLSVTAISAVDGMDEEGRPKPGYSSGSCRELMRLILAEQDQLARSELRVCHAALDRIACFGTGGVQDFSMLVEEGQKALEKLKAVSLPLKSFYAEAISRVEERLGFWRDFIHATRAHEKTLTLETMAMPAAWANVREKFADAEHILTVFQHNYAEKALQIKNTQKAKAVKARVHIVVTVSACLVVVVILIGIRQSIQSDNDALVSRAYELATAGRYTEALQQFDGCRTIPALLIWPPPPPSGEWVPAAQAQAETARQAAARAEAERQKQALTIPDLGMTLQPVAAGEFQMGANDGSVDDKPAHRVQLTRPFWIGKTEVTQRQWELVMGNNPSHFKGADNPVECVSWNDCVEFCRKLTQREQAAGRLPVGYTYRLPTEAQWEYACRAGTTTRYNFGNETNALDQAGWYDSNSGATTNPVGQKAVNAWGLHDMHGNVWEWCQDWYGPYDGAATVDPTGAASGDSRVLRGGSWMFFPGACLSAFRLNDYPSRTYDSDGFRVVCGH